jgi:hypothetical protein
MILPEWEGQQKSKRIVDGLFRYWQVKYFEAE